MNDVKLENVELQEEEVNIYTPACGETRYKCIADCLWVIVSLPVITRS